MTSTDPITTDRLPRAAGNIRLICRASGHRTVLDRLYQSGSSKALLPRTFDPGLTAVLLNTAGGITGGDRFDNEIRAGRDTTLILTTQTAERAYRALPGQTGNVTTRLRAENNAVLRWLPQETIVFDGAALTRRLEIDLDEGATLLAVEPVVLGRAAMGEEVRDLRLSDTWRIRKADKLIYADGLRIAGNAAVETESIATLGGHLAFAAMVYVAPDADRQIDTLRTLLGSNGGASLVHDGVLAARLTAPDGMALRKALIPALEHLHGTALPRTWKM